MDREFDYGDRSPRRQRYMTNPLSPIGLLGRGRALSLIVMGAICLFAYLNHTDQNQLGPTNSSRTAFAAPAIPPQEVPVKLRSLVAQHGGVVDDNRTQVLRQVGKELASTVTHLPAGHIKFFLVKNEQKPFSAATSDGNVIMSVAQFAKFRSVDELAENLSQRIAEYVYKGYDARKYPQVGQYRDQLLAATGYRRVVAGENSSSAMVARRGSSAMR